jgi:hypothetical protein
MVIPPWLKPPDLLGAATAGAKIATERRGQDIEQQESAARNAVQSQEIGQRAQEVAARMQLAQQHLDAQQQQNQVRTQLAKDKLDQDFQIANTRTAVASAYQQQRLEQQKQQVQQTGTKEVKRLADLKGYQDGLAAGKKPLDLAQQFPDAYNATMWGEILRPDKNSPKSPADQADIRGKSSALSTLHKQLAEQQSYLDTGKDKTGAQMDKDGTNSVLKTAYDLRQRINSVEKSLSAPNPSPAAATAPAAAQAAAASKRVPNAAAIKALKADPSKKDQFDQFYGDGSSDAILSPAADSDSDPDNG